jgi:hypothetical protein
VFRLGYNTNGLAHHRPIDALHLLADLGYEGVALTPDVGSLDPYELSPRTVRDLRAASDELGLALAVETGARFVLDPRRKHRPTLLEDEADGRQRRIDFLVRSLELAAELGADTLSLWSGAAPEGMQSDAHAGALHRRLLWSRLCDGRRASCSSARVRSRCGRVRAGAGHVHRTPSGYGLCSRSSARRATSSACASTSDTYWSPAISRRVPDPPLGAAARPRPPRRHPRGCARAPHVPERETWISLKL